MNPYALFLAFLVSIVVHGISVTPVMRLLERPPDRSA
jgi:hypothetical protein